MKNSHQPIAVIAVCAITAGYCIAEARHLRKENARIVKKNESLQEYWTILRKAESEGKLTQDFAQDAFWKLIQNL